MQARHRRGHQTAILLEKPALEVCLQGSTIAAAVRSHTAAQTLFASLLENRLRSQSPGQHLHVEWMDPFPKSAGACLRVKLPYSRPYLRLRRAQSVLRCVNPARSTQEY